MKFTMRALARTTAMAAVLCLGAWGAQAKVDGDTIILGSALSETGKYSTNGVHTKNGYELAVKLINDSGGVMVDGKSYKFDIIYYDDESTPARGAQLAERLINQDGVKYMLGPYSSGLTKAIAPVTEKYGVPMVEAEGASRSLFTQGYKYLFAVLSTSEQYLASAITLAAEKAKEEGKDPASLKVAMAFENDPFSLDVRAGVLDDLGKYGMKVVIDDKLPRDLSDMAATLTKVKALNPDILVISGHSKGAATAARQIGEMGVEVPMLAITHCEAAKIHEKFPENVENVFCATQWSETLTYEDKYFGTAAEFDAAFKAAYSDYTTVPYQSAQAAAAVLVWKEAFESANSFDPKALRDALSATDMETFYGGVKFSEAGNNIAKPMVMRQIQDGKYVVVAPSKWAAAPARLTFK